MPKGTIRFGETVANDAAFLAKVLGPSLVKLAHKQSSRRTVIAAVKEIESVKAVVGENALRSVRLREALGLRSYTTLIQELDA